MNRYPRWAYILLGVLIIIGVIYAAPNLYGEDPAIQISNKSATPITPALQSEIISDLNKAQIPYSSVKKEQYNILFVFSNIDQQLKAQGVLQNLLGPDYTVALNLAEKTPVWLKVLGAKPMKLGLDLRGGIHFLLEVDVDQMVKERVLSDSHTVGDDLRLGQVRYTSIKVNPQHQMEINFKDDNSLAKAQQLLSKKYNDYQFIENDNGMQLTAQLYPAAINQLEEYAVSQNLTTLRNRVNELGVSEPVIQQQGKDQISVDLPGVQDTARAKAMIGKVATIRLQLQDMDNNAEEAARTGIIPFGSTLFTFEGRPILLKNQIILHGSSILNASTTSDSYGRASVSIRAGGSEIASFNRITNENVGRPLATVYVETQPVKRIVNGKTITENKQVAKIINIATINEALNNMFQIEGLESQRYAQDLALQLRSGSYTAPVSFVQERLIGPSLGKDNIHKGVLSTLVGAIVVILFMAFYYHLFGIIADLALVLNLIFIVAIMSLLGATLTLPGIAAIVLTVGMAVDANVLIYERIREELRNGMSPQASINAGYGRALVTIVDANVTTLIVAIILFTLGTGTVQGFAIVLIIGLLTSMITAIFFSRAMVNLVYGSKRHLQKLSIGINVKKAPA